MKTENEDAYASKLRACNKEALVTVIALVATVIVWVACGFGLAGVDVWIWGMPLWAVTGTVGTWVFAIIVAVVLSRRFFCDFDTHDYDDAQDAASSADKGGER